VNCILSAQDWLVQRRNIEKDSNKTLGSRKGGELKLVIINFARKTMLYGVR
jgi:hypothetical protein